VLWPQLSINDFIVCFGTHGIITVLIEGLRYVDRKVATSVHNISDRERKLL